MDSRADSVTFGHLAHLRTNDDGATRGETRTYFNELQRRSKQAKPFPKGLKDLSIACFALYLAHEKHGGLKEEKEYQKQSTVPVGDFRAGLKHARVLLHLDGPSTPTTGSAKRKAAVTPTSSAKGKSKQREPILEVSPSRPGLSLPSRSTSAAPSPATKRARLELQTPDRSAAMKASTARSQATFEAKKATATPSTTPIKSSPLKPQATASTGKGKGKGKATPTTSVAKAAKRAEKRADAAEAARRPPVRPCMVPDHGLWPWANFEATLEARIEEARDRIVRVAEGMS